MTPIIAADWLKISINVLLLIHVIICLLLALVVLMQRPKQEGLGAAFGGGLTDQAFGARTTDVLQKGTVYLGTLFFIVTLVLAILIGKRQSDNPTVSAEDIAKTEEAASEVETQPAIEEEKPAVELPKQDNAEGDQAGSAETPVAPPIEKPAPPVKEPVTPTEKPAPPVEEPAPAAGGQ